jgi:hypothetical protein
MTERHITDWLGKKFTDITVEEVKTEVERHEQRGADDEDLRSEYDKGLFVEGVAIKRVYTLRVRGVEHFMC